jgi:hypothetical protein
VELVACADVAGVYGRDDGTLEGSGRRDAHLLVRCVRLRGVVRRGDALVELVACADVAGVYGRDDGTLEGSGRRDAHLLVRCVRLRGVDP